MKFLIFPILTLFFLPMSLLSQAPFTGGNGDGHAQYTFFHLSGDPAPEIPFSLAPSAVPQGEEVKVRAFQVRNKVHWILRDLRGIALLEEKHWNVEGVFDFKISSAGLSQGIYILDLRIDGNGYRRKLLVEEAP